MSIGRRAALTGYPTDRWVGDFSLAGEAIGKDWEGAHGHATAALRYGLMSRPQPTKKQESRDDEGWDPRREAARAMLSWSDEDEYWEREEYATLA